MEVGFLAALGILIAFFIGVRAGVSSNRNNDNSNEPKGILNVAYSDLYDAPDLFLNLQVPVEDVISQKSVVFYVNVIRPNSQK